MITTEPQDSIPVAHGPAVDVGATEQVQSQLKGLAIRENRTLPPIPLNAVMPVAGSPHAVMTGGRALSPDEPGSNAQMNVPYSGPMTAPAELMLHEDLPPPPVPPHPTEIQPIDPIQRTPSTQSHGSANSISLTPIAPPTHSLDPAPETEEFILMPSPQIMSASAIPHLNNMDSPHSPSPTGSTMDSNTGAQSTHQENHAQAPHQHQQQPFPVAQQQMSMHFPPGSQPRPPFTRPMQVPIGPDGRPMSMMMVNGRPAFVVMRPQMNPMQVQNPQGSPQRPFVQGARPMMLAPPGSRPMFLQHPQQSRPGQPGQVPMMMRPMNGMQPIMMRPGQPPIPMIIRPGQQMVIGPQGRPMMLVSSQPPAPGHPAIPQQPMMRPMQGFVPQPGQLQQGMPNQQIPPPPNMAQSQSGQSSGSTASLSLERDTSQSPFSALSSATSLPPHMLPYTSVAVNTSQNSISVDSKQDSLTPPPANRHHRDSVDSSLSPQADGSEDGGSHVGLEDMLTAAPASPESPQLRPTFVTIRRKKTIRQQQGEIASPVAESLSPFGDTIQERKSSHNQQGQQRNASVEKVPFEKTIALYRENALRSQDPSVQFEFAKFCIENGEEHVEEGFSVLKRVAATGYPDAQQYLGEAYCDDGRHDLAYAQFLHAAKKSHPPSCHSLGELTEEGKGCRKNKRLALEMYMKAATAGHVPSMVRLGRAERDGDLGLKPDINKAVRWFKRGAAVASREHPEPLYELTEIYSKGYGSIGADINYARSVLKEACSFEYPPALVKLGYCYEHGQLGCPLSAMESIRLYRLAAAKDDPEGLLALAGWYMTGATNYLKKDEPHAFQLAKRAADQDHARALYTVGYFYESGVGVQTNKEKAIDYYIKAAEHGENRALETLEKLNSPLASQAVSRIKAQQRREKRSKSSFFGFFGN